MNNDSRNIQKNLRKMKKIKFYIQAFILITFSKEFQSFERDYFEVSPDIFFMDGERNFSEKEKFYMEIITKCYNKQVLY